jgi:hypothetical protein
MPLILGYSRGARFKILLDKLFNPLLFGRMNPYVQLKLNEVPPGRFESGKGILKWLSSLNFPNKAYQSAHSYFLLYHGSKVRLPPHPETIHNVELEFLRIEHGFSRSRFQNSSFFSYNWLLHKIFRLYKLDYYCQFVKDIKCDRRFKRYENMWTHIKTLGNVAESPDKMIVSQTQPVALRGDGSRSHLYLQFLASPSIKNHRRTVDLT